MTVTRTPETADTCDRCGARAKMRAQLVGGELFFCAHHGREHGKALWDGGARVDNLDSAPGDHRVPAQAAP